MARESRRKRDERHFGVSKANFFDELMDSTLSHPYPETASENERMRIQAGRKELRQTLDQCTRIVAEDVSRFYWVFSAQETWCFTRDFPCCFPPFGTFWIEAKCPASVRVGDAVFAHSGGFDRYGLLFRTTKDPHLLRDEQGYEGFINEHRHRINNDRIKAYRESECKVSTWHNLTGLEQRFVECEIALGELREADPALRQRLVASREADLDRLVSLDIQMFVKYRSGTIGMVKWKLLVGPHGNIRYSPWCHVQGMRPICSKNSTPKSRDGVRLALNSFLHVGLLTITFMHAKGTKLEVVEPSRELNRARKQAGKRPFLRHHTINVDPVRRILETDGGLSTNGLQKALHLCRGHFATYGTSYMGRTLDKPMVVWRPAHVRGNAKNGVVTADYNVQAPAASA